MMLSLLDELTPPAARAVGPIWSRGSDELPAAPRIRNPARQAGRRWPRLLLAGVAAGALVAAPVAVGAQGISETDRAALEALYQATDGSNWRNNTNWLTDAPLGEWHGVATDEGGRVTSLDLVRNQLSGLIPSSLGSLANLQELHLNLNQLSGAIPSSLGTNLQSLDLSRNQLSGAIPSSLGSLANLERLWLGRNQLSGAIPSSLGSLANLERLWLGRNQLSGPIPDSLASLSNLQELWLNGNQLSGSVPSWLGSLASLTQFSLSDNQLSGAIPSSLASLANLQSLDLSRNQLSGLIPSWLGSLANLRGLYLAGNQFSGTIPGSLASLANLERLFLGGIVRTEATYLASGNQLSGPIPSWLGSLTKLEALSLGDNQLSGPIPDSLASLVNLEQLYLYGNQLSGSIPGWLGSLVELWDLQLGGNDLSGAIPGELGSLANLRWLTLNENTLSGRLPSSMTNLRQLELLWIYNNAGLCAPADAAFLAWLATIDDFQGDTCAVNGAPQPVGRIPAQTLREGAGALALNVAAYFQDPNGDPLSYTAVTSNGGIVTAAVSGSTVFLTPVSSGTATVTVTARDPAGLSAGQSFNVTVSRSNQAPEAVGTLPDVELPDVDATREVDVSGAFTDPDDDALTYTATSSAPQVVTVLAVGSRVTLTGVGEGAAAIQVTATDPDGLSATQSFRVRVTAPFTDDPIVPGETPVRAVHFTELRARIDVLRSEAGLARFRWTDPELRAGVTWVRRVHLIELRTALDEAYRAAGRAAPRWTDPAPVAGTTPIRAVHLTELRAAVLALE